MSAVRFDVARGLAELGELVRLTAAPASTREISEQGIRLLCRSLGASGAALILRRPEEADLEVTCTCGKTPAEDLLAEASRALSSSEPVLEGATLVGIRLPGETGPVGAIVVGRPRFWGEQARAFSATAARVIAAALRAAATIEEGLAQRELLAQRNLELEILNELARRLEELSTENEMLQAALELVLEKLGLRAGWIFWGREEEGRLSLAAARGISERFVRQARQGGIGRCLCADVFETGRLQFARNTVDCPRLPELVEGREVLTHACVPLKFGRGVLGVMNIANLPGRLFTPQELRFLETVGRQVAVSVDRARRAQAERKRAAEAQALASLARATSATLELEKVLEAVASYVRELLEADRCAILLGEHEAALRLAFLSGPPMSGLEVGSSVDLGKLGARGAVEALRQKRTLAIEDASTDPRANAELARAWSVGSTLLVPLLAHEQVVGLLMISRFAPSAWPPAEIHLGEAFGRQAAVAIENARLYQELRESLVRLHGAQESMVRAERLAAVGTLAASLAHEVRNPLNSINLQLVLLSRRAGQLAEPERARFEGLVEAARREVTRLETLVQEFLALSSTDRVRLLPRSPGAVLREVAQLMAPVAREHGVSVREEISEPLPEVPLDADKLKQALINLVRNAIEAMPSGGRLTLSAEAVDAEVHLRVADTGVGIPPGVDVFDVFLTTKEGGTGLGLPIVRRIVEAHGGRVFYETQPGAGTVFTIALAVR
jgi:signal transduction histidine kinase